MMPKHKAPLMTRLKQRLHNIEGIARYALQQGHFPPDMTRFFRDALDRDLPAWRAQISDPTSANLRAVMRGTVLWNHRLAEYARPWVKQLSYRILHEEGFANKILEDLEVAWEARN